ncbi:MAG: hypothetical protein EXS64_12315 [Candidatus Latescibacteria bacterium]|nr:hypothetical protein [Candidatus Latescibacterota bacterium]
MASESFAQTLTPALPYPVPMGVGMFRVRAAEPLSKGQVAFRYLNEGYTIQVRTLGGGGSFTGHVGFGFGLANMMDVTLSLPLLLDSAGGLMKYGSGDAVTTLKLAGPGKFPSGFYFGLEATATHPTGYKGIRALNTRPFTAGKRDLSTRLLIDINRNPVSLHLNVGQVLSGGGRKGGMILGGGIELGKGQLFTVTGEYVSEPGMSVPQTKRMTLGAHFNLGGSFRLEAALERGLSKDLPELAGMVGFRIVARGGAKAKKTQMIRTKITAEDINGGLKPGETIRVAVVNFAGLEDNGAGRKVGERLRSVLSAYGRVQIVPLREDPVFLDLSGALELAKATGADLVITGRVLKYDLTRTSSAQIPLVVGFPKTVAEVEADIRVVERKKGAMALSARLGGRGEQKQGIRLLPTSSDDQMTYLGAREKEQLRDQAVQQLVSDLVAAMASNFKWLK